MPTRCHPRPRPAGVFWVPADQFNRIAEEAQTNPCVLERFPFEPLATLGNPAKHAEFAREHLRVRGGAPTETCNCQRHQR
jgi:hypothetical protein